MICLVEKCQRDDSKRRFKMGYCDAHYQRVYFHKDPIEINPVKEYAKRGSGLKLIKQVSAQDNERCVEWAFGKDDKGYGAIFYRGKRYKAHRLSKMFADSLEDKEPPRTVFACHRCDNRLCINPKHVYWGTAKSNKSDQTTYYYLNQ